MMRKKFFLFLSGLFLVCSFCSGAFALDIPPRPDDYVTDRADLLSPETEARLETLLRSYEQKTTNQILIATFPSLEGENLEDFSIRLAETWKPGQKGRDNGVIFLVFKDDHKARIEVGYGLEGALPDALAGQILQQRVLPYFRADDYEKGIVKGVEGIILATQGEYETDRAMPSGDHGIPAGARPQTDVFLVFTLMAAAVIFVFDLFRYWRYRHDHRLYRYCYSFWEWFFRFALLVAIISILFRILFYAMLFSRGGYYGGRSGFGGFSAGGGSFGGGGASGRW